MNGYTIHDYLCGKDPSFPLRVEWEIGDGRNYPAGDSLSNKGFHLVMDKNSGRRVARIRIHVGYH